MRQKFLQETESQEIFPRPAAQRFLMKGRRHRAFERQATLVAAASC